MMFKRKGGGVKGFLNNVQKTALFLRDGFPYLVVHVATIGCTRLSVHTEVAIKVEEHK